LRVKALQSVKVETMLLPRYLETDEDGFIDFHREGLKVLVDIVESRMNNETSKFAT
jgi:hypothetical protein